MFYGILSYIWASLIAQLVKNPPAMQETPVLFLGQEDPLEKGMATHSSILGLPLWLSWERLRLQCRRPRLGRSPGEGKAHPLQYSGLENSMDCTVPGVTESQTGCFYAAVFAHHGWKSRIPFLQPWFQWGRVSFVCFSEHVSDSSAYFIHSWVDEGSICLVNLGSLGHAQFGIILLTGRGLL